LITLEEMKMKNILGGFIFVFAITALITILGCTTKSPSVTTDITPAGKETAPAQATEGTPKPSYSRSAPSPATSAVTVHPSPTDLTEGSPPPSGLSGWKNPKPLTDADKAKIVQIAVSSSDVIGWMISANYYSIDKFNYSAIVWNSNGNYKQCRVFSEADLANISNVSPYAYWYPEVDITLLSSQSNSATHIRVSVDLDSGKTALVLLNSNYSTPSSSPNPPPPSTTAHNPLLWQNVSIYSDPQVSIITQVNQTFILQYSLRSIPYAAREQISDPDAFLLLDALSVQQTPSTPNVYTTRRLFKAVKAGSFQISYYNLGTGGDISSKQTFNIIVNPNLSSIVVAPVSSNASLAGSYKIPPLTSAPQFTAIQQMFVFGYDQAGTNIPSGSTIYHWKNKITEVIGPDNSLILLCKDDEVKQIPTPGAGWMPVTHNFMIPNGRIVTDKDDPNIQRVMGIGVIGTIVNIPDEFPYTPAQVNHSIHQYFATGYYDDGSSKDITSQVVWNSSNPGVASVSSNGSVSTLTEGTADITASLNAITSVAVALTVNSLSSIEIKTWNRIGAPNYLTKLKIGSNWRVWALGKYSNGLEIDITDQVIWTSVDKYVAVIDQNGMLTALAAGTGNITASLNSVTSPAVTFTVPESPLISSIEIIPASLSNQKIGYTQKFQAKVRYSDGSIAYPQVTWNSSNSNVVKIANDGLAVCSGAGVAKITASLIGITSDPVSVTVEQF
jgi:hypothetical protein